MAEDSKSSSFFGSPLITSFLALCGLGGAGYLAMPKNQEAPSSKPGIEAPIKEVKGKEEAFEAPAYDPLRILETHFARSPAKEKDAEEPKFAATLRIDQSGEIVGTVFEKEKKAKTAEVSLAALKNDLKEYDLELVIACLPDPLQTKFAHEFDWTVDAIQRALETRGMTLRLYDLPWERIESKITDEKKISKLLETPGVLLFSKSRRVLKNKDELEARKMALVFLVGESPIVGIRQTQFHKAVEACRRLGKFKIDWPSPASKDRNSQGESICADGSRVQKDHFTVIGPYYSGSQGLFARALNESILSEGQTIHKHLENFCIHIFNGGSSELKEKIFFEYNGLKNPRLIPKSFIVPNDILLSSISNFINGNRTNSLVQEDSEPVNMRSENVIILSESNTGFGTRLMNNLTGISSYGFPISISQLSSKQFYDSKKNVTLPFFDFVGPRLSAKLLEKTDQIAAFDPQSNAAAASQWLRTIIEIIQTKNVKHVGILATDTRDVVFLNKVLKNECNNIQIFTTEPNIAIQHPEDSKDLRGMLVAASYPNYSLLADGPPAEGRGQSGKRASSQIFFPASTGYGYFNAVIAGKGQDEKLLWCAPGRSIPLGKGADTIGAWISMVGTGGKLIPLHFYLLTSEDNDRFDKKNPPISLYKTGQTSSASTNEFTSFTRTFLIELCIVYMLIFYAIYRILSKLPIFGGEKDFVGGIESEVTPETAFWSAICLFGLVLAVGAFSIPGLTWKPHLKESFNNIRNTLTIILSLLLPLFLISLSFAISSLPLFLYKFKSAKNDIFIDGQLDKLIIFRFLMSYIMSLSIAIILYFFSDPMSAFGSVLYLFLIILETIKICLFLVFYFSYLKISTYLDTFFLVFFIGLYLIIFLISLLSALTTGYQFTEFEKFFILLRINDQSSGLSPLAPMLLLGLSAFTLGLFSIKKEIFNFSVSTTGKINLDLLIGKENDFTIHLNKFTSSPAGSLSINPDCAGTLERKNQHFSDLAKKSILFHISFFKRKPLLIIIAVIFAVLLFHETVFIRLSTGESRAWDIIILISTWIILFSIIIAITRIFEIWDILKSILDALKKTPFRDCFKSTPRDIKVIFSDYFGSVGGKVGDFNKLIDTLEPGKKSGLIESFNDRFPEFVNHLFGKRIYMKPNNIRSTEATIFLKNELNTIFNTELKESSDSANSYLETLGDSNGQFNLSNFSVAYFVIFFSGLTTQLRKSILAAMGSITLAFLAFASYPFQPEGLFIYFLIFQMVCLVALTCIILYELNVHPIPSNITGTAPDQLSFDWKFIGTFVQFVGPLLLLLALHFLGFLRFIIEPILDLLR